MTRIALRLFMMSIAVFALDAAADDPEKCPMHDRHIKNSAQHHSELDDRGDQVMGFEHRKTDHHFYLTSNGGIIRATVKDTDDEQSLAAIRSHMREISALFANGDFQKPLAIHGAMPTGAETMKELGKRIDYNYEELENGAQVRIVTNDTKAIDAVHSFLRFQIREHRTGDSEEPID